MWKALLFFVIIFCPSLLFSQTIPYATQQPQWVFPVYAKDATGKRDTIYLGHNPGASSSCTMDPTMGEIWFPGVNDFSLSTYYWISPLDSIVKTSILNNILYYDCGKSVTLSKVVLPMTFYWDISLMRSDSLPFPDQDPAPRAQLNIGYNGGLIIDEPGMICDPQYPIVATDSITNEFYGCFVKDSLRLLDLFGNTNPQTISLSFEVVPWTGNGPLALIENSIPELKIFPNPASDKITISGLNNERYVFRLLDIFSREVGVFSSPGPSSFIDISSLPSGIYFLSIAGRNFSQSIKFIKN